MNNEADKRFLEIEETANERDRIMRNMQRQRKKERKEEIRKLRED